MLVQTFRQLGPEFKKIIGLSAHSTQINRTEIVNSTDVFQMQVLCATYKTWLRRSVSSEKSQVYTFSGNETLFPNSGADTLLSEGALRIEIYEKLDKDNRTFPSRHFFSEKQKKKHELAVAKAAATRALNKAKKDAEVANVAAQEEEDERLSELVHAIEDRHHIQDVFAENEEIEVF